MTDIRLWVHYRESWGYFCAKSLMKNRTGPQALWFGESRNTVRRDTEAEIEFKNYILLRLP